MEENKITTQIEQEEVENSIDFGALWHSVVSRRRVYTKVLGITFVVACIIALSIPRNYTCQVMLAPELSTTASRTGLSALASTFGLNLGNARMGSSEALFPTLYPDLMNSVDFKTSLFSVKVRRDKEEDKEMTYYDYLLNEQKKTWWSAAIGGTLKAIVGLFVSDTTSVRSVEDVDPFRLTKKEESVAKMINKLVVCDVDKKSLVITIQVTDQDPLICATMADSVQERLQKFITDYRTSKARCDLEYNQKLFVEAKREYDKARRLYAEFTDANQDIILQSVRTKQIDLENEMQLKYNAFNTIATQLEAAKAKVQEETPAFTMLQSATVPLKPSSPKRVRMVFIFLFLAFLGTTVWAFYKDGLLKSLLGLS
jgi:capsular polysaccharide biosynthesis protein